MKPLGVFIQSNLFIIPALAWSAEPDPGLSILKALNHPRRSCPSPASSSIVSDETVQLEDDLQCTENSKKSGYKLKPNGDLEFDQNGKKIVEKESLVFKASVQILKFKPKTKMQFVTFDEPQSISQFTSEGEFEEDYPNALFVGNGPIFDPDQMKGYLKPIKNGSKDRHPVDCSNIATGRDSQKHDSWATENSVLMQYHPMVYEEDPSGKKVVVQSKSLEWRLVSTDFFCRQLCIVDYVSARWSLEKDKNPSITRDEVKARVEAEKVWTSAGEKFVSANQIVSAIQSGPAVIRRNASGEAEDLLDGKNLNIGTQNNLDSGVRSYSGIDSSGNLVMVQVKGNNGHYCLGKYLREKHGIVDLLHRDSLRVGAEYRKDPSATLKPVMKDFPDNTTRSALILTEN